MYAASVLTNMASQEELRKSILAHEAMPALVELLHSTDNNILISAAQAVASLACDAEARMEVTVHCTKESISKVYTIATAYQCVGKTNFFFWVSGCEGRKWIFLYFTLCAVSGNCFFLFLHSAEKCWRPVTFSSTAQIYQC